MKKGIFYLFLALLLSIIITVGCSSHVMELADSEASVIEEFTVFSFGGPPWGVEHMDDPIGRAISERTGVRLVYDWPVGEWSDALELMIASRDFPDIIVHESATLRRLVEAGALLPLREKIENAPNISGYLGEYINRLSFSMEDREIYAFGHARLINNVLPSVFTETGFSVQFDVLEQAGWPLIKSLQDFENIVANHKAAHPIINGQPSIGITFSAADSRLWRHSLISPMLGAMGMTYDGQWHVDPVSFRVSSVFRRPEPREYFRWLNHLHHIGLLDPESFIQSHETFLSKIASGRVIGVIDAMWKFDAARLEAVASFGEKRDFMAFPALMDPENTVWKIMQCRGLVQSGGYSITIACRDPDKIVSFFDFLASDEGQILKAFGVENVHHTVENGLRLWTPKVLEAFNDPNINFLEFRNLFGLNKYSDPGLLTPGIGYRLFDGSLLNKSDEMSFYNDQITDFYRNVLDIYGLIGFNMLFPQACEFPDLPYPNIWELPLGKTEETMTIMQAYVEMQLRNIARAVLAAPEDFDAKWDMFLNELEAINISLLEEEATQLLRERMIMWGTYTN